MLGSNLTKSLTRSIQRPEWRLLTSRSVSITAASNGAQAQKTQAEKYQELKSMKFRPLYLDAQATSVVDPRVLDAMLPYMTNMYGNPHSRTHAYGWESEKASEQAREVSYNISNRQIQYLISLVLRK